MEFKELMALKPAEPIISLGTAPEFCDIELRNGVIINVKQLERMKEKPKEAPAAPAPEPKKKTKAKLRRERIAARQAERIRREEERRAARVAVREPEPEDEEDDPVPVAAAPAARLGAVMDRLVARVAGAPAPVAAAPVARPNINAPEIVAEVNAKDPGARRMKFWEIIARLQWHNRSDGAIGQGSVNAVINVLTAVDMKIFEQEYNAIFAGAIDFLRDNGMFERNGARTMDQQSAIVSHIIALGEEQYNTLIADPEILQFLVEAGECQSLNALLPEDIRV